MTDKEDIVISITPRGLAVAEEARRRVRVGLAPDLQTAIGQVMRAAVLGDAEWPSVETRAQALKEHR